ncbi:RING finger and CHY zinc finger domain-containing protein 1 [Patella vulgata]|uniref:RING finger and CHY zinc finger domain-containing protein 1 n=1 Tax=Patella vulgata TaxID=6465 RepID=UPI00217FBADB|nr:RING finger and CHY zinc finger domain-containing protein 1 [Patella vulgata]
MATEVQEKVDLGEDNALGCEHYKRKCFLISPCCNKEYTCRICHDDNEVHQLNRRDVRLVKCMKCNEKQKVQGCCYNCGIKFGNYFCNICNLYDDDTSKKQFHCTPCGLCRIGGRDNFFHCIKCDVCLALELEGNHKCIEKVSHDVCPICRDDLHTSRRRLHVPKCGHLIHFECYASMLKSNVYACPTCSVSLVDMSDVWESLDGELANTQMPDEYKDVILDILCRDCHKTSKANFHVVGLKCGECGSYNTCRN